MTENELLAVERRHPFREVLGLTAAVRRLEAENTALRARVAVLEAECDRLLDENVRLAVVGMDADVPPG